MSAKFTVHGVWDLGETIHIIGTVTGGVIKGSEVLRTEHGTAEIRVSSVALGGGANLPADAITLVVEGLPCSKDELVGKELTVIESDSRTATTIDGASEHGDKSQRNLR